MIIYKLKAGDMNMTKYKHKIYTYIAIQKNKYKLKIQMHFMEKVSFNKPYFPMVSSLYKYKKTSQREIYNCRIFIFF